MKNDFEQRRANRIERAKELAVKNEQLAKDSFKQATDLASVIPMGQPILIGHHSEKRHRRHLDKIDNSMRKGIEAGNKAKYYEEKAETIENSTAISSDDPKALDKLRDKLEKLQGYQEFMKSANKIIRDKKLPDLDKIDELGRMGCPENKAQVLLLPDYCGRIGFPSYKLTNNNANINRLQERVEKLEALEGKESKEETIGEVRILVNMEANRVQIFFPGKPSDAVRSELKGHGFRWSPREGAWQRQVSNQAEYWAKRIVQEIPKEA